MEGYKHFSHPHTLSFQQSLEGAQLTCTGCNFPCTDTPIYSCRECEFFLHDQCFNTTRSLIHPSHPDHPLSLFPSPTYTFGSFICKSCNKTGSGLCFGCSTCDFDLHIHCAYNSLNSKLSSSSSPPPNQIASLPEIVFENDHAHNPEPSSNPPPNQIKLRLHPTHPLKYFPKPPHTWGIHSCDVCGTGFDPNGALYRCDICDYDAHVTCVYLPETVRREGDARTVSLLYVNPHPKSSSNPPPNQIKVKSHPNHMLKYLPKSPYMGSCSCDVCGTKCNPNNELYHCDICGYDAHVTCVNLPETIRREDHEHTLSLLHANPHPNYQCDVCRGAIAQNHCMYHCMSGCDYGIHIKCVSRKVSEKAPVNEITFDDVEMRPFYWAILIIIMVAIVIIIIDNNGYFCNRRCRNGYLHYRY